MGGSRRRLPWPASALLVLALAGCGAPTSHGSAPAGPDRSATQVIDRAFPEVGSAIDVGGTPVGTPVDDLAAARRALADVVPASATGARAAVLRRVATMMADAHADPAYLCAGRLAPVPLRGYWPGPDLAHLDQIMSDTGRRLSTAWNFESCAGAHFDHPAVIVGPQRLSVGAVRGTQYAVRYQGEFDYRLLTSDGRPQLTHGSFSGDYTIGLPTDPLAWVGWSARWAATPGLGAVLPAPPGRSGQASEGLHPGTFSAASLRTVRRALSGTLQARSGSVTFTRNDTALPASRVATYRYAGQIWPADGDARYDTVPATEAARAEIVVAHSGDYLELLVGQGGHRYTRTDPTRPPDHGTLSPGDSNPFTALALVAAADRASTATCRADVGAQHCYHVRIPVRAVLREGTQTGVVGYQLAALGLTGYLLEVGVSDGTVVSVRQDLSTTLAGPPGLRSEWVLTFAGLRADGAGSPVQPPAPGSVAPAPSPSP